MTFPAELERLLKEATEGEWSWDGDQLWHFGEGYSSENDPHRYTGIDSHPKLNNSPVLHSNKALIVLLRNHADAILGLVRAAEDALLALNMGLGQTDAEYEDAIKQAIKARDALTQELAKLNGEGK